ncbi:MAG: monovalent cation/H+ antiporter complex subunit F [bacterium]
MSGLVLLGLVFMVFIRIIKGPSVMDRIVGVNIIGTKATVLIVISGVIFNRLDMFVDIAIAYACLNFIASIATSKFFQHYQSLPVKKRQ